MSNEKSNRTVTLKGVVLSYPSLFKMTKSAENGEPKYRASFLIDKNTKEGKANHRKLKTTLDAAIADTFKGKTYDSFKWPDPKRTCFIDGDEYQNDDGDTREDYEGHFILKSSTARRPSVVNRNMATIDSEDGDIMYGGCIVNCVVSIFAVNDPNKGGRGCFASLDAVQRVADGTRFGSGPVDPNDYFEDLGDDGDEADDDDI